jgi:hypothetical protein
MLLSLTISHCFYIVGHSKGQILKRCYGQSWIFARSTSSTAYFFLLFQAWGCSNFVEKSSRDDGLCQDAEPISELYFRGLGDAITIPQGPCSIFFRNRHPRPLELVFSRFIQLTNRNFTNPAVKMRQSYAACACGTEPRRGPPAALPWANRTIP